MFLSWWAERLVRAVLVKESAKQKQVEGEKREERKREVSVLIQLRILQSENIVEL